MTREEMIAALKKADVKESNALNVKKAEDTIQNITTKEVKNGTAIEDGKTNNLPGVAASELPTQKDVEKEVNKDVGPIIPADKDGVSKDGGDCDKLMSQGGVEAERKKQDSGMKDVINVSSRKVDESSEVNNELLSQLKEAAEREESLRAKISEINALCEQAIEAQKETLTKEHAAEMNAVFEAVILEGSKMEAELNAAIAKNEKMYKTAKKLHESSSRLNKILLEAVKKAQPEKVMLRYTTPAKRAVETMYK